MSVAFAIAAALALAAPPATTRPAPPTRAAERATENRGPLTRKAADAAVRRAWKEYADKERSARQAELKDGRVTAAGTSMRFAFNVHGKKPKNGRSLYISMHGGGGAPTQVNDQQWENQKRLYQPKEGIYCAPRAPGDTWDLWHQGHIDPLFDRLITSFVIAGEVDPDRVYLMGYSAGGDGVYQVAPRMADRFAAAAMMAGHPNETKPDGLYNLPFTLHMGGKDGAYKRNEIARQWKTMLAELAKREADAGRRGAYPHEVVIHESKGHWMDREDAVAVEWMAKHTRETRPKRIVWLQDDVTEKRFYWLASDDPKQGDRIEAAIEGQTITIENASRAMKLRILLDDEMLNLDRDITVRQGDRVLFQGRIDRSEAVIARTLAERGDPKMIFVAEVAVDVAVAVAAVGIEVKPTTAIEVKPTAAP
jgi:hypothetical protein